MDFATYDAAHAFVNNLKSVDPVKYREVDVEDVLPYFEKIVTKLEKIRV